MSTISVCMIVKNEEDCIEKCVKSLQSFADEICIYDTGSTDDTVKICKKLDKVKIIKGEWRNDFAWARNQSFQMATGDYLMWVDADDIVDEKSQEFLQRFKENDLAKYDLVYMMYRYNVTPENTDTLHFYRGRIARRILYPTWNGRIHETMHITATSAYTETYVPMDIAYISHYKHKDQKTRNLDIFRDMDAKNEIYRGRDWFYYGNECRDNKLYDEAIDKYRKCVETPNTWVIEQLNSYLCMAILYQTVKHDQDNALKCAMLGATCTAIPRADICCIIGDIYKSRKNWIWAKFWYERAVDNVSEKLDATFLDPSCYTWKPRLNLCVCEYNLGNFEAAERYNDEVLQIVPDNVDAINNKKVFEKVRNSNTDEGNNL